jgi:hypothetical protein
MAHFLQDALHIRDPTGFGIKDELALFIFEEIDLGAGFEAQFFSEIRWAE